MFNLYDLYIHTEMHQDFQKTLVESITLRVGPEPVQAQVPNPVDPPSPGIEDTAAAYHCLHQNNDGCGLELTMGEDRAAPLITVVCILACINLQIHS